MRRDGVASAWTSLRLSVVSGSYVSFSVAPWRVAARYPACGSVNVAQSPWDRAEAPDGCGACRHGGS